MANDNDNAVLRFFKNYNKQEVPKAEPIKLKKSWTDESGEPKTGTIEKDPIKNVSPNLNGSIKGDNFNGEYSINSLKRDVNGKNDDEIQSLITSRGATFASASNLAMQTTTKLISDQNNYSEKDGLGSGKINLAYGNKNGSWLNHDVNEFADSMTYNDSFVSNQVEYDRSGDVKSIGGVALKRLSTKFASSVKSSFDSAVGNFLSDVGILSGSDYPFQGRSKMFGALSFDPGATNKYAIVIEEPDLEVCASEKTTINLNASQKIDVDAHHVSGSNLLSGFTKSFLGGLLGDSYPTISPYKDIWSSGWVPCTGFQVDYGRVVSESLGISPEFQFELPTMGVIAPVLTTEILEDNQQSVRRWLKDYFNFISPAPGIVRPYKTCCCKITVLTYNKEWSRDPGDASDSVLNFVGLGNSQNKNSKLLKFVFYAYPSANISYQTSPVTNIDSVTIQWNVVGEKQDKTNLLSNLVNKFL